MRILYYFFLIFCLSVFYAPPSGAKMTSVKNVVAKTRKVEAYLNSLESVQSRFTQTNHNGTQLNGMFYMKRPGRLRFEYDPPIEDFVVADRLFVYFYDAELGEQTHAPIGTTLADFLLRSDIELDDDITVTDIKRDGGFLQVDLIQTDDPGAGSLTLALLEDPMTLKRWRVVDAQGLITEVELLDLQTNVDHPSNLFIYVDPNKPDTARYND